MFIRHNVHSNYIYISLHARALIKLRWKNIYPLRVPNAPSLWLTIILYLEMRKRAAAAGERDVFWSRARGSFYRRLRH